MPVACIICLPPFSLQNLAPLKTLLLILVKMSVLPYIKRNRTLYRNLLEKEAAKGRDLMDQDLREVDIRAFSHKVNTCIKRINEFIGEQRELLCKDRTDMIVGRSDEMESP